MQKARQNIRVKWMLQDLIHEINGCSHIGYQRPLVRAEYGHWNRDRPGGYMHSDLKIRSVENIFTDEVGTARRKSIKKVNRKLQRNNHKKVVAEALADYKWCNEPDEFSDHYNEIDTYSFEDFDDHFTEDYLAVDYLDWGDDIEDAHETWHRQENAWFQIEMGYYRDEY